jgi:alpha-D-ribose 1-methylphosphonate 5-triphosphate synthase subunit PhnG
MTASAGNADLARQDALSVLARADAKALADLWAAWSNKPEVSWVRPPETGLIMVRGRIGGGGAAFNVGEATMSRASARIPTGEVGHGYCLGRDTSKAGLIAIVDALFQRDPDDIEVAIVAPLRHAASASDATRRAQAAATKVDFFTMVRGEDE